VILLEKTSTSQVFTALKKSTRIQTIDPRTGLIVLAHELNQMVTELQGENKTGHNLAI
jgi:hypothetical protein